MKPELTVLMPVKAFHGPYLREAVDSIRDQTSPDWRLLVIAAPSARRSVETVLADSLADPRIALVEGSESSLGAQFNTGMREAETDWTAILLGDDLWAADAVEVLAREIDADPTADFLHSARRFVDEDGRPISSVCPSRRVTGADDFVHGSPVKHLLCWRRDKALACGGMDESLKGFGVDDFDFPWTMHDHGARFRALPDCLYVARDHRAGFRLTTHLPLALQKRELARIMRKHGVPPDAIAERVRLAQSTYLKQALYRSRVDRWWKTARGHDPRGGWRETYR